MAAFRLPTLAIFLFLLTRSDLRKILFTPLPYMAHIAVELDLAVELSQRGHSVAVALPNNFKDFFHRNSHGLVQFLDLGNFTKNEEYLFRAAITQDLAESGVWLGLESDRISKALLVPLADVLMKERPDVLVSDQYFILSIRSAVQLGIPVVAIYTTGPPGDVTNYCKDLELRLLGKLESILYLTRIYVTLYAKLAYYGVAMDDVIPSQFVQPLYGVHISFPGYNFPFQFEYPLSHVFVGFTSRSSLNESKFRQEDLELKKYLDELPENTQAVYIAFGSIVRAKFSVMDIIVQGVLKNKDTVIVLSWPAFKAVPNHWPSDRVPVEKWTHQLMVLKHNRTKLFVTHGGIRSMEETISSHTPVIVMPQCIDQIGNGLLACRAGIGLCLIKPEEVTIEVIEKSVTTILSNYSSFKNAVRVVDRLSQLAGGARRAGDLIESVFHSGDQTLWIYTNQDKLLLLLLILTPVIVTGSWMAYKRFMF